MCLVIHPSQIFLVIEKNYLVSYRNCHVVICLAVYVNKIVLYWHFVQMDPAFWVPKKTPLHFQVYSRSVYFMKR